MTADLDNLAEFLPHIGRGIELLGTCWHIESGVGEIHTLEEICTDRDAGWVWIHDGELFQRGASIKSILSQISNSLGHFYRREFGAVAEHTIEDVNQLLGQVDALQVGVVLETVAIEGGTVGEVLQVAQVGIGATGKDVVTEVGNLAGFRITDLAVGIHIVPLHCHGSQTLVFELDEIEFLAQSVLGGKNLLQVAVDIVIYCLFKVVVETLLGG